MNVENCAGVAAPPNCTPCASSFGACAGSLIDFCTASLIFATTSGGRPFGPMTEYQLVTSKPRDADFGERRHVGQLRQALRRGDRERAQLAGLDVLEHRRHRVEVHVDLAADQIDDGLAAALVRDVIDLRRR